VKSFKELISEANKKGTYKRISGKTHVLYIDGKEVGEIYAGDDGDRVEYYFTPKGDNDWETYDVKFGRLLDDLAKKYGVKEFKEKK
jgi:hypothetical protein